MNPSKNMKDFMRGKSIGEKIAIICLVTAVMNLFGEYYIDGWTLWSVTDRYDIAVQVGFCFIMVIAAYAVFGIDQDITKVEVRDKWK